MQLLRDIALFVEVVNTKSFTRAAANLDMPASTLSRRISGLEKEIGLQLLNRTTRRVEVTDAGSAYYAKCAHLVDEARVAHEQLAETVNLARGTLRVTCSPDFAALYLPQLLMDFTQRHPAVDVELDLGTQIADLGTEHLDAALRIGPLTDSSLVARKIATLHHGLYASPHYLASTSAPERPDDLKNHNCIRMKPGDAGSHWQLRRFDSNGKIKSQLVQVGGRIVVSSVATIRKLAVLGGGIGIVDQVMARDDVSTGSLVQVLPDWELPPVDLNMVTASRLLPARVRLFGDFLAERLASYRGPLTSIND